jgi:hypothetical protein
VQPENALQAFGGRVAVQEVTPVFRRIVADFQLPGVDIERCPGVKLTLDLRVECRRMLVGVRAVAPGEVTFALTSGLIAPADLPSVARAVLGSGVELGPTARVPWYPYGGPSRRSCLVPTDPCRGAFNRCGFR